MPRTTGIAIAAALSLLASPAAAEQLRLTLDPERTSISFELGATLHSVEGTAQLRDGEIVFLRAGGAANGRLTVDASSADTGNERRDRDMHDKVLESEEHPEIAFRVVETRGSLANEGTSDLEIIGVFSIHGGEHDLTVPAQVSVDGSEVEAILELEVPYVAWGMKNPSKLLLKVSKEVTVRIVALGTLDSAE